MSSPLGNNPFFQPSPYYLQSNPAGLGETQSSPAGESSASPNQEEDIIQEFCNTLFASDSPLSSPSSSNQTTPISHQGNEKSPSASNSSFSKALTENVIKALELKEFEKVTSILNQMAKGKTPLGLESLNIALSAKAPQPIINKIIENLQAQNIPFSEEETTAKLLQKKNPLNRDSSIVQNPSKKFSAHDDALVEKLRHVLKNDLTEEFLEPLNLFNSNENTPKDDCGIPEGLVEKIIDDFTAKFEIKPAVGSVMKILKLLKINRLKSLTPVKKRSLRDHISHKFKTKLFIRTVNNKRRPTQLLNPSKKTKKTISKTYDEDRPESKRTFDVDSNNPAESNQKDISNEFDEYFKRHHQDSVITSSPTTFDALDQFAMNINSKDISREFEDYVQQNYQDLTTSSPTTYDELDQFFDTNSTSSISNTPSSTFIIPAATPKPKDILDEFNDFLDECSQSSTPSNIPKTYTPIITTPNQEMGDQQINDLHFENDALKSNTTAFTPSPALVPIQDWAQRVKQITKNDFSSEFLRPLNEFNEKISLEIINKEPYGIPNELIAEAIDRFIDFFGGHPMASQVVNILQKLNKNRLKTLNGQQILNLTKTINSQFVDKIFFPDQMRKAAPQVNQRLISPNFPQSPNVSAREENFGIPAHDVATGNRQHQTTAIVQIAPSINNIETVEKIAQLKLISKNGYSVEFLKDLNERNKQIGNYQTIPDKLIHEIIDHFKKFYGLMPMTNHIVEILQRLEIKRLINNSLIISNLKERLRLHFRDKIFIIPKNNKLSSVTPRNDSASFSITTTAPPHAGSAQNPIDVADAEGGSFKSNKLSASESWYQYLKQKGLVPSTVSTQLWMDDNIGGISCRLIEGVIDDFTAWWKQKPRPSDVEANLKRVGVNLDKFPPQVRSSLLSEICTRFAGKINTT